MDIKELRIKLSKSTNLEWFKTIKVNLDFPYINYQQELTWLESFYEYLNKQILWWKNLWEEIPNEIKFSKNYFQEIQNQIDNIINSYIDVSGDQLTSYWNSWVIGNINAKSNNPIPYNDPIAIFLYKVFKDYWVIECIWAHSFLLYWNITTSGNKRATIGAFLAYEFYIQDETKIPKRWAIERKAISTLRSQYEKLILEWTNQVSEHIKKTNEIFTEYSKTIDDLKIKKESDFDLWFSEAEKIKTWLEQSYKESLKLKEPANYWKTKSTELKKEWMLFLRILMWLLLVNILALYFLVFNTPEEILKLFVSNDYKAAIKWSILFITFVSFSVYWIRIASRSMLSSYHLARDAEERYSLTYFYLALSKDTTVEKEERLLVMQSLFSRSDSWLLNTDTAPTLPSTIMEKIISR